MSDNDKQTELRNLIEELIKTDKQKSINLKLIQRVAALHEEIANLKVLLMEKQIITEEENNKLSNIDRTIIEDITVKYIKQMLDEERII